MISYNDLYELLRKEKYSETLQALPNGFVEEFSIYLNDRKQENVKEEDFFTDQTAKSKKQLENSISLFKELMRIRKKKILSLVFLATETGIMKRDYENMFAFERETFDRLVKAFEDGDKELAKLMSGKKEKEKNKLIIFNQSVEQFVNGSGQVIGPFAMGELANVDSQVSDILVQGGKASFVDEN